jgi:hypothetical protein
VALDGSVYMPFVWYQCILMTNALLNLVPLVYLNRNSINDEASRLQQAENADIGITPQFEGARKRHVDAVTATVPQLTTAATAAAAAAMPMPMAGLAALEAAAKAASSSGSNSLSASPTMFLTAGGGIAGSGKRQRV